MMKRIFAFRAVDGPILGVVAPDEVHALVGLLGEMRDNKVLLTRPIIEGAFLDASDEVMLGDMVLRMCDGTLCWKPVDGPWWLSASLAQEGEHEVLYSSPILPNRKMRQALTRVTKTPHPEDHQCGYCLMASFLLAQLPSLPAEVFERVMHSFAPARGQQTFSAMLGCEMTVLCYVCGAPAESVGSPCDEHLAWATRGMQQHQG